MKGDRKVLEPTTLAAQGANRDPCADTDWDADGSALHHLPRLGRGALCERALAAAVFDAAPVRPLRSTLEAARAALRPVLLCFATVSPFVEDVHHSVQTASTQCQPWCTLPTMADVAPAPLGTELMMARAEQGRSLRDVAEAAEISPAYLQKLER